MRYTTCVEEENLMCAAYAYEPMKGSENTILLKEDNLTVGWYYFWNGTEDVWDSLQNGKKIEEAIMPLLYTYVPSHYYGKNIDLIVVPETKDFAIAHISESRFVDKNRTASLVSSIVAKLSDPDGIRWAPHGAFACPMWDANSCCRMIDAELDRFVQR